VVIWYLILYSSLVSPFEAGQYQTYEKCEAAAQVQVVALRGHYGPGRLFWRCEKRIDFEGF
jgi:hypothetical protein